eukprot:6724551-Pyramimonas_sp.AAC.1
MPSREFLERGPPASLREALKKFEEKATTSRYERRGAQLEARGVVPTVWPAGLPRRPAPAPQRPA